MKLKKLVLGDEAPDFTLPDSDETMVSLKGMRGSWVVLYFYPKDDTPGCTTEAIGFTAQAGEAETWSASLSEQESAAGWSSAVSCTRAAAAPPVKSATSSSKEAGPDAVAARKGASRRSHRGRPWNGTSGGRFDPAPRAWSSS